MYVGLKPDGSRRYTYRTNTVSGAVHAKATILISMPQGRPSEKRSLGIGLPKQRRQITAAMEMLYAEVIAIIVSETIALKPTTGPKLTRDTRQDDRHPHCSSRHFIVVYLDEILSAIWSTQRKHDRAMIYVQGQACATMELLRLLQKPIAGDSLLLID